MDLDRYGEQAYVAALYYDAYAWKRQVLEWISREDAKEVSSLLEPAYASVNRYLQRCTELDTERSRAHAGQARGMLTDLDRVKKKLGL